MRFQYISPSLLPSKSANSVHVVWQCDGLCRAGAEVALYSKRTVRNPNEMKSRILEAYGVENPLLTYRTFHNSISFGTNLQIASFARRKVIRNMPGSTVLSRNLYAAFVLAVVHKKPLLFETHQLEYGFRKSLQRQILICPWVRTIVISKRLETLLKEHHRLDVLQTTVLHDAAPEGSQLVPVADRRRRLSDRLGVASGPWKQVCGYFGHLYQGRGIEVVQAMAASSPENLFLVFGGNSSELNHFRNKTQLSNLVFMGHVSHPEARSLMSYMDVLLMPYQRKVSVGGSKLDTARWMSPMKMFEYLAAGVPIISSDLPVLREVLSNGENCLLVPPSDAAAWSSALNSLVNEPELAAKLGGNAHMQYSRKHTWTRRAEAIISMAQAL